MSDTAGDDDRFDLIQNINPETSHVFSHNRKAITEKGLAWFSQEDLFWKAAEDDAREAGLTVDEYLSGLDKNFTAFLSLECLHGREDAKKLIRDLISSNGVCNALILGGQGIGKTVLLQELCKLYNDGGDRKHMVLYISAKDCTWDIAQAFNCAFADWKKEIPAPRGLTDRLGYRIGQAVESLVDFIHCTHACSHHEVRAEAEPESRSCGFKFSKESVHDLIEKFIAFALSRGRFPVVMFDQIEGAALNEEPSAMRDVITELVWSAERNKRMMLIVSSPMSGSEYMWEDARKFFGRMQRIVLGDLSPKQTFHFLVNATEMADYKTEQDLIKIIGMGRKLATLCLAAYGGHLALIHDAVLELRRLKEHFSADCVLHDVEAKITKCLEYEGTRQLLEKLAAQGFVAEELLLDEDIVNMEHIVNLDLGCYVSPTDFAHHFDDFRSSGKVIFVPSFQALRLAIARQLVHHHSLGVSSELLHAN